MPLIIKRNVLKVKEPNSSTYRGIDAVTDETAAQKVAQINAAGAEQIQAIEDKGDEVAGSLRESIVSASASAVAPSQGAAASYDNATGALQIDVPRGPGPVSISDGVDLPDGRTKYTMTFEGVGGAPGATFDFYVKNGISLEDVYPVGAIYISTVSTSPYFLFHFGTWERITDKFLLASGQSYDPNTTGGAATQTVNGSNFQADIGFNNTVDSPLYLDRAGARVKMFKAGNKTPASGNLSWTGSDDEDIDAVKVEGTQTISTMPPYMTVYMWRRTA